LTCEPGSVPFSWRWVPLTEIMPRYSIGGDDAWALGPTELFSRLTQGPWAGSFAVPVCSARQSVESRVTVGGATGTLGQHPRFELTSCGRKVGSREYTARFESVGCCVPDRDFVGPRSIGRQR